MTKKSTYLKYSIIITSYLKLIIVQEILSV